MALVFFMRTSYDNVFGIVFTPLVFLFIHAGRFYSMDNTILIYENRRQYISSDIIYRSIYQVICSLISD